MDNISNSSGFKGYWWPITVVIFLIPGILRSVNFERNVIYSGMIALKKTFTYTGFSKQLSVNFDPHTGTIQDH